MRPYGSNPSLLSIFKNISFPNPTSCQLFIQIIKTLYRKRWGKRCSFEVVIFKHFTITYYVIYKKRIIGSLKNLKNDFEVHWQIILNNGTHYHFGGFINKQNYRIGLWKIQDSLSSTCDCLVRLMEVSLDHILFEIELE